jgi:hypothetical protein
MALITKASNCGFDGNMLMKAQVISGLVAGETLTKFDSAYIKSDGLVYRTISSASTVDGKSCYDGFVFANTASGDVCDLVRHVAGTYSTGLTPGAALFTSGSAGVLSDAQVLASDSPIAKAITTTEILAL